ncbi:acyl-CoA dehydrogenase family protein [Pseudorhizobium flavum]|uniref:Alkylation response protein AidB-like acyl-CoA dehydrogenase n=1 Tax=Pseudorhizobium flavum TaxID=1335061 RepID=A0A7W9Z0S8_9HYPH|nr:acyl-CoA dehydrogenase family protein [Pseudorhizobium flavum]MBB6181930.1 alkylation response protein AidB-like acyl-CoA dehydrogenase [Pseudorhizobium flavum]CAD6628769.1 acyl-CoA dehydrogenase [Pseudorhizobium flavum]
MVEKQLTISSSSETEDDISRTIAAICEDFPGKYWRDLEDAPLDERYPEAFVAAFEAAGFLAAGIPEEYGGVGLPMNSLVRIVETIHANGCNGDAVAEQIALTAFLCRHAASAVKAAVLPRLAAGEARFQSLAIWEPESGRQVERIAMAATAVHDGFSLSGMKRWVRFADRSNYSLVAARTGEGISLLLVNLAEAGHRITVSPTAAMNNFGGAELTFDAVFVPQEWVVGDAAALRDLEAISAILAAAAAAGCSRFFSRKGVRYANERVVFGNPIGKYQGVQFPLAQCFMESEGAHLLLQVALAHYEAGEDYQREAMLAQHLAVQAAWDSADAAFSTHGGFAFAREYDVERKWREVRFMRNEATGALRRLAERILDRTCP